MHIPRICLAGTHSGVGKTTITLGLLSAMRLRGIKVQPYKVGPDYIDPGLHQVAAGRISHNLDSWMGTTEAIKCLFLKHSSSSNLSLIEGVMGLFDGARGQGESGSTAQVAKILQAPVVLVFSAKGLARSAAALVTGYKNFDPSLKIAGVIANGVGSSRHTEFIRDTIEGELGLPLLGALKEDGNITIPSRQLGLVPAEENQDLHKALELIAQKVESEINIDKLIAIAEGAVPISFSHVSEPAPRLPVRLGVARDGAFSFYYQDSLDYLRELGAELHCFSPLQDSLLPSEIDGLYFGGGFPEEFLPSLTSNSQLMKQIKLLAAKGMPIYAECGGFMYLCNDIQAKSGDIFPGVGLVPARATMGNRLAGLGYVKATLLKGNILGDAGVELRGHEFHWSTISGIEQDCRAFSLSGGRGQEGRSDGYVQGNLLATYVHLHFRYNPGAAKSFLAACVQYQSRGKYNAQFK